MKQKILSLIVIGLGICAMAQDVVYTATSRSHYNRRTKTVYIGNDASEIQIAVWGSPKGIDCFGWTMGHEKKHHKFRMHFWPGDYDVSLDFDRDGLRDTMEATLMPNRPYDPNKRATYPDTIGYGVSPIPDGEDICMRDQDDPNYGLHILWINGSADEKDWSNPGKQHKDKY